MELINKDTLQVQEFISSLPCRVSSDPHERRNDLSTVSTMHPVKLKYQ